MNGLRTAAVAFALAAAACGGGGAPARQPGAPGAAPSPTPFTGRPNVIVVLADDLGWGDLSSYGAAQIRTPHLDRLAQEGARFTQFYVAAPVCTPSRGALLTGLYPPRTGIVTQLAAGGEESGAEGGMPDTETTLAEALRDAGYATAMVGKWHLGQRPDFLPTRHGFERYYGIPTGYDLNDMLEGERPTAAPALEELTRAYTARARQWIGELKDRPFFLYFSHRAPHVPLAPSSQFAGRSAGGVYGDDVEELDWSVGQLVEALREHGLERRTLVLFLSDNGPWLSQREEGGSAGPLYSGKGSPFEGGIRVPALAWWPGRIPAARTISEPAGALDLLPTLVPLAGGRLRADRVYYGADLMPLLAGDVQRIPGPGQEGGREFLSFSRAEPVSLRSGRYKYVRPGYWSVVPTLFDLETDPGERNDLYAVRPELAATLRQRLIVLEDELSQGAPPPVR
ncbi:MAG: sulfatase [Vicinamibacteria bacterium]|nr:sulfatase [Vicinamibacteria bacterium]